MSALVCVGCASSTAPSVSPDAATSDTALVAVDAWDIARTDDGPAASGPPVLTHLRTFTMPSGTHRPEIFAVADELLVLVVHPAPGTGSSIQHRGYRYNADLELLAEPFMVSEHTETHGGPADHRAWIAGDTLLVTYQSNVMEGTLGPCAEGPAEACALTQSLLLARFDLDGTERFRGPIMDRVPAEEFATDSFPDHCLWWQDGALLVSTGSVGNSTLTFREVDPDDGAVLATHRYPTDLGQVPSAIGNSLFADDDGLWLLSHDPVGGTLNLSPLGVDYAPGPATVIDAEGLSQTFPTGVLALDGGYVVIAHIARSDAVPHSPTTLDYHPYLKLFGPGWQLADALAVGDGSDGTGHLHPTVARIGDTLYYAWSGKSGDGAGPGGMSPPQVRIEVYGMDTEGDRSVRR